MILRTFDYPEGNIRGVVSYINDEITFSLIEIGNGNSTDPSFFTGPNDGIGENDILIGESCILSSITEEPTGNSTKVIALDSNPYAQIIITENAPLCVQQTSCDLTVSVTYDTINNLVLLIVNTSASSWLVSNDGLLFEEYVPIPCLPGQSDSVYVRDADNCLKKVVYTMPGGNSTDDEILDTFVTEGETVTIYLTPSKQLRFTQSPNVVDIVNPINAIIRNRVEGEFVAYRCIGTTQRNYLASFDEPYLTQDDVLDSVLCGFSPPTTASLVLTASGVDPTELSEYGSLLYSVTDGVYPVTVTIHPLGYSKVLTEPSVEYEEVSALFGIYTITATSFINEVKTAQVVLEEYTNPIDPPIEPPIVTEVVTGWSLSWSAEFNSWSSYHSYVPTYCFSKGKSLYLATEGNLHKQLVSGKYGEYLNKSKQDWLITFISNEAPRNNKKFDNLILTEELRKETGEQVHQQTVSTVHFYNDRKNTGLLTVDTPKNYEETWKIRTIDGIKGVRVNEQTRFAIPCDRVIDPNNPILDTDNLVDSNSFQPHMTGNFLTVTMSYDNTYRYTLQAATLLARPIGR